MLFVGSFTYSFHISGTVFAWVNTANLTAIPAKAGIQ